MSESITLARPYARAAFELAEQQKSYAQWSDTLQLLAAVSQNADVHVRLISPSMGKAKSAEMMLSICADKLDDDAQNFVKILAENNRLSLLSEISELFEVYRADAENTLSARVVSAFDMQPAELKSISASLSKRLGRKVSLQAETDDSLIGGAIVYAGDLVIDGSVKGQLQKLASTLIN